MDRAQARVRKLADIRVARAPFLGIGVGTWRPRRAKKARRVGEPALVYGDALSRPLAAVYDVWDGAVLRIRTHR